MPVQALPTEPRQLGRREAEKVMPAGQAYLLMAFRTIPLSHPDLYPLDLISFILSNGESARLVRSLREERRLVSGIAAWSYTPGYDAGEFAVYATLAPDKVAETRQAILAEVMRFREELVSEQELRRSKRQKIAAHVFGLQTVEAQAGNLASDILAAHDPTFSRSYVERIQRVTAEEIRDAARKYFREENLCVAVVRPPAPKGQPQTDLTPAGPAEGEVRKTVLANGLRLLVKRNPAQPIVSVQAFFLAGVRAEPPGKNGLSMFTARMMPRGTAYGSAEEIAQAFDDLGGSLGASSGNNSLYLSAACLAEDLPVAMEILADVVREPAFDATEMARLRPLLLAAVKRKSDDWRGELADRFRKEFFQTHPYRNSPVGTPEALKGIQRDDLVAFHRKHCLPGNMVLAVFGDVQPDDVLKRVEKHFGDWRSGSVFQAPSPAPEPRAGEDTVITEKTTHKLAGVFVGFGGLTLRDTADRYAMDVLDAITSGIHLPRGWLHEALRGKGLVYEVHAYNFVGLEPGYFGIYAGCEPERAEEVKEIILRQVRRVSEEPIPAEEMEAARRICVTADVLERQTNAGQATRAALDELYGMGFDYGKRYAAGVLAVSEDDVKRVAGKYLTNYLCVMMLPGRE